MDVLDSTDISYFTKKSFIFKDVLGKGGFGSVFLVWCTHYNCYFAVKKIPEENFKKGEAETMSKINHPNVISLYGADSFCGFVYLIMDYCPKSLQNLLDITSNDNQALFRFTKEILLAVKACHDRNISHRDIKPSNLLLDQYNRVKICDFGLAIMTNHIEDIEKKYAGTYSFLPPEIRNKSKNINPKKVDIWSLGVTFYYMATNHLPFSQTEFNCDYLDVSDIKSFQYKNLVLSCLNPIPEKRPDIDSLLEHKLFQIQKESLTLNLQKTSKISHSNSTCRQIRPRLIIPSCRLKNLTPKRKIESAEF